jgi:hypothetical protein
MKKFQKPIEDMNGEINRLENDLFPEKHQQKIQ